MTHNRETTAWRFLKRNPNYQIELHENKAIKPTSQLSYFHFFSKQRENDQYAEKWGLYAFENTQPLQQKRSPFWIDTPTLEADIIQSADNSILSLVQKSKAIISALQLLNNDLLLKIENIQLSIQIRIRNGCTFSAKDGLSIRSPLDLSFPQQMNGLTQLWQIINQPFDEATYFLKMGRIFSRFGWRFS